MHPDRDEILSQLRAMPTRGPVNIHKILNALAEAERVLSAQEATCPVGICNLLSRGGPPRWLLDLWRDWPKYSGEYQYPVPGGRAAYHLHRRARSLWIGEQGELRRELMAWTRERLEQLARAPMPRIIP